jgi:hypothetical protein
LIIALNTGVKEDEQVGDNEAADDDDDVEDDSEQEGDEENAISFGWTDIDIDMDADIGLVIATVGK